MKQRVKEKHTFTHNNNTSKFYSVACNALAQGFLELPITMLSNSDSIKNSSRVIHEYVIRNRDKRIRNSPMLSYLGDNTDSIDVLVSLGGESGWVLKAPEQAHTICDHVELLALKKNVLHRLLVALEEILRIDYVF